jgi:flagellar hook-length control protein FliK
MNVNGASTKIAEDSGKMLSESLKAGNAKGASIMDPGKATESTHESSFRKRYEEIARANERAEKATPSHTENRRENKPVSREVIEREHQDPRVERPRMHPVDSQRKMDENRRADDDAQGHQTIDTETDRQNITQPADENQNQPSAQNGDAESANDQNVPADEAASTDVTGETENTQTAQPVQSNDAIEEPQDGPSPETAAQAADILCSSLVAISESLNIKVSEGIYHLDLQNPGEASVKEISEILYSLKGITACMDNAVKSGEPVEVNGQTLQNSSLADMEKVLQQEIFKIECALNLLGIGKKVLQELGAKMGVMVADDIPVALDPSKISMPAAFFDQMFSAKEKPVQGQMHALLEKLAGILRTADNGQAQQAMVAFVSKLAVKADTTGLRSMAPVDPEVMRKLLGIDGTTASKTENLLAAQQNEKMDLPKTFGIAMGKSLLVQAASEDQQSANAVARVTELNIRTIVESQVAVKLPHMPAKLEESVLQQVVAKFSSMLKMGANEIRIMLHPRELGDVHLKVKIDGDVVVARIQVENQQVKQIVESNLQSLKNALVEHDLKPGTFSVDVGTNSGHGFAEGTAEGADQGNQGTGSSKETNSSGESADSPVEPSVAMGRDTGKRYGDNSIELYV